jgi:hypothetical protein
MNDKRKAEAVAAARVEIARRIARFCASLSAEEFDRLLDRMAHIQWKYDVLPLTPDPPLLPPRSERGNRELSE